MGATLAPLFGGYIYEGMGWKAVLVSHFDEHGQINAAMGSLFFAGGFMGLTSNFLAMLMEETNFERQNVMAEARDELGDCYGHATNPASYALSEDGKKDAETLGLNDMAVIEPDRGFTGQPSTWRPWATFGRVSPQASGILLRGFVQPLALLGSPLIWWIDLLYGIYQIWFNTIGSLVAFALSSPPYNFSAGSVGLTYIGSALSCIPGAVLGGWLSDRHCLKKAKAAGGIFEPEYRLSLFWVPSIIVPIGLLMMGLGLYYQAHWIVFVLEMTLVNMAGPLATVLVISYAFDCYHPIESRDPLGPQAVTVQDAPYILTSMFIAMAMAFGYGYAVTPWIVSRGFRIMVSPLRHWQLPSTCRHGLSFGKGRVFVAQDRVTIKR